MNQQRRIVRSLLYSALLLMVAAPARAQVTPAAGYTPPDDTPAIRVGATIFADYTFTQKPEIQDADGNAVKLNAFWSLASGRVYVSPL